MVLFRLLAIWLVLLLLAVVNGMVRESAMTPRLGERPGQQLSSIILAALIFVVTLGTIAWLDVQGTVALLGVGLLWAVLTVAFEFVFGRVVMRRPWEKLLADYHLHRGRLWPLVLLVLLISPLLTSWLRQG